jgi:hypothetical protein
VIRAIESLERRQLLASGNLSTQIIVDQFGWRADAPRKVVIFADPINGQNSGISYTPGAAFQIRRVSDDGIALTGNTVAWKPGTIDSVSGDKVWWGDFSTLVTPGEYYVYDPTNDLHSYTFRLDNTLFNDVLKTSIRTYFYQRSGIDITAANGGNWNHPASHVGPNQDHAAKLWQNGAPVPNSPARDVYGGWYDAGDFNRYVPFTTGVMWDLLSAFEWNPSALAGDDWNIPEGGNGVPDQLDEVKWELDWLRRMQLPDGSVMNRVSNASYDTGPGPNTDTQPRYYTAATTWATASFAASLAHASRVFANYNAQYPGYATTLLTAAQNAWAYLQSQPTMFPANGTDNGNGLASAPASSDAAADLRVRILAAAELFRTTGNSTYRSYFDANYNSTATNDNGHNPILNNHFDASLALELNRALITYALTPSATPSVVTTIRNVLKNSADNWYLPTYNNGDDPYRAFMWTGHYTWGSNQLKSNWANLFVYASVLNVNPANQAKYREIAEEYLHYFHGRNPLSELYLTNMGTKGANLGGDQSAMQPYHGWFQDGSPLYDGPNSTYGPAPGYLVGGPNQYFSRPWIAPPAGEPPMKAFKDWNTVWNNQHQDTENSWEITEPAIYYQAAYSLLLSRFAAAPFATLANNGTLTVTGTFSNDTLSLGADANNVNVTLNGQTLSFARAGVSSIVINALSGDDVLTFSGTGSIPVRFNGGLDNNTLNVTGGVFTFDADAAIGSSNLTINVSPGASVTFNASQHLAALNVSGTATLTAGQSRRVLVTRALTIPAPALLDLATNDLLLDYTGGSQLAAIQQLINTARAGGAWNGNGLTSSAARNNPQHNTTLGAMEATDYKSIYGSGTTFDGESLDDSMVLVKYTYYGDTDFNGRVNFDDYVRTDNGFNNHQTGWMNGDFDGNGQVNFDDYVLLDLAFNTQSGILRR